MNKVLSRIFNKTSIVSVKQFTFNFTVNFSSNMTKSKVYLTRTINQEAMDKLQKQCDVTIWTGTDSVPKEELIKNIVDKDALFCFLSDKIDKDVLDKAKNLKVIGTMSVGYDHLDIEEIKKRKIKVGFTPNILTDATAELTIALLLATSRRLFEGSRAIKNGEWKPWSPFWMCGPALKGSTVGIVGFGRIGQAVARILKSFNVKEIVYSNRSERTEARELGAVKVTFDSLLKRSDFIIACCSLTPETKDMFNDDAFNAMKRTAVFINTSRGGVVDQDALIRALTGERIWGAGLDVMTPEPLPANHRLLQLQNCVVIPHIGSATTQTRLEMADLTVENIVSGLDGKPMPAELIL